MIRRIVSWIAIVVLSFGLAGCERDRYEKKVKTPSGEYKEETEIKKDSQGRPTEVETEKKTEDASGRDIHKEKTETKLDKEGNVTEQNRTNE